MDTWKHGRYVDLWSLVHFLSGALIGVGLSWTGFDFIPALVITMTLLVLWEVYEWLLKILEPAVNVGSDLIIGLLGFFLAAYWHYFLGMSFDLVAVAGLALLTALLALWGFSDLFRRGYR